MKEFAKNWIVLLIPMVFAAICLGVSVSVMNGYEDCWRTDSHHGTYMVPNVQNCANDRTLLTRDVFLFLGIILTFAPLAASLLIEWRKEYGEEIRLESIKISEQ